MVLRKSLDKAKTDIVKVRSVLRGSVLLQTFKTKILSM